MNVKMQRYERKRRDAEFRWMQLFVLRKLARYDTSKICINKYVEEQVYVYWKIMSNFHGGLS